MVTTRASAALALLLCGLLAGCPGPLSVLDTAGRDAQSIATLTWIMLAGGAVIWLVVMGIAVHATLSEPKLTPQRARTLVIGGGVVFPTAVLTVLLIGSLSMMPALLDVGPTDGLQVRVFAEQYWWRVRYATPDGQVVESANEIRLPLGRRTPVAVASPDVVHSLWIPALGGKIDAIPGRTNWKGLEPTRTGRFRGVCAEFCGPSHARMGFTAVVMEPADFEAWLRAEASPRTVSGDGEQAFLRAGCGACHTVRGTPASGSIGPDLTHVGSRSSLVDLDNDAEGFEAWLRQPSHYKPGVLMPAYDALSDDEITRIARWLEALQ